MSGSRPRERKEENKFFNFDENLCDISANYRMQNIHTKHYITNNYASCANSNNNSLQVSAENSSERNEATDSILKPFVDEIKSQIAECVELHPLSQMDEDEEYKNSIKYNTQREFKNQTPKFNRLFESSIAAKSIIESSDADFEREEIAESIPKISLLNTFKEKLSNMNESFIQLKENICQQSNDESCILK